MAAAHKTGWRALAAAGLLSAAGALAQTAPPAAYDEALAARTGADEYGMRSYVFVLLRTGPNRTPDGPARDELFRGHFANMKRLAEAGHLVLAGPFDGVEGWRGLFILAVKDIEEAKKLASTDPVLASGEMVAEYHRCFGSAALVLINELHAKLAKKSF